MATKKKPAGLRQPARWFLDSVARGRANDTENEEYQYRQKQIAYIRDGIKKVRKLYKGFESKDGYNLTDASIARMHSAKMKKVAPLIRQTNIELASPHKIVFARTKARADALYKHTRQKQIKGRKAFVVHVSKPDTTKIVVQVSSKQKGAGKKKQVSTVREIVGGSFTETFFYFADYLKKGEDLPETIRRVISIAKRMLKDMPRGYYVMLSGDHGNIGAPMLRSKLLDALEVDWLSYDKVPGRGRDGDRGLAGNLIGFKFISTNFEGAILEYNERLSRRAKHANENRRIKQSKIAKRRARIKGR